ncbi:MAG: hypothetical protein FJ404_13530 [Verrucomicrobia bacterium]|nr:hypothetical protein [Verrucomicrobiota bacterium]
MLQVYGTAAFEQSWKNTPGQGRCIQRLSVLIGSGAGDCAPAPSHTTGRAVFRIRRLNAAALHTVAARSDGIQNP